MVGATYDGHVFNLCKWRTDSLLDVPWIFDRRTKPSPHLQRHQSMPPRHETVSKSGCCWQLDTEGSSRYLMICAAHHGPRWFCWLCPESKKISLTRRGCEQNVTERMTVGDFTVELAFLYLQPQTEIRDGAAPAFSLCHETVISALFTRLLYFRYHLVIYTS